MFMLASTFARTGVIALGVLTGFGGMAMTAPLGPIDRPALPESANLPIELAQGDSHHQRIFRDRGDASRGGVNRRARRPDWDGNRAWRAGTGTAIALGGATATGAGMATGKDVIGRAVMAITGTIVTTTMTISASSSALACPSRPWPRLRWLCRLYAATIRATKWRLLPTPLLSHRKRARALVLFPLSQLSGLGQYVPAIQWPAARMQFALWLSLNCRGFGRPYHDIAPKRSQSLCALPALAAYNHITITLTYHLETGPGRYPDRYPGGNFDASIDREGHRAPATDRQPTRVADGLVVGLYLFVLQPSGMKSWALRYRVSRADAEIDARRSAAGPARRCGSRSRGSNDLGRSQKSRPIGFAGCSRGLRCQ